VDEDGALTVVFSVVYTWRDTVAEMMAEPRSSVNCPRRSKLGISQSPIHLIVTERRRWRKDKPPCFHTSLLVDEGCKAVFSMSLCYWLAGDMGANSSITGNLSAAINTNDRNQRQSQAVELAQQALQRSLVKDAGLDYEEGQADANVGQPAWPPPSIHPGVEAINPTGRVWPRSRFVARIGVAIPRSFYHSPVSSVFQR
jgi:hypothetical protein